MLRAVLVGAMISGVATLVPTGAAQAFDKSEFDAPFPCREEWRASTRSGHSPSYYSVDFNADDDLGRPVLASAPGRVEYVRDAGNTSYGKYLSIDHGDGWSTLYAHLLTVHVVEGQWLDQGDQVGLLGTSGGSSGPHLHFEQNLERRNQHAWFAGTALEYGTTLTSRSCGDRPAVGDWNGDRVTDLGVFRRSARPAFVRRLPGGDPQAVTHGTTTALPLTGDWDGDGRSELGSWERSTREFALRGQRGRLKRFTFGTVRDLPVTGDWDGDGRSEVGVFRPSTGAFRLRAADGAVTRFVFGTSATTPVTGDWDGDGRTDVGGYDRATGTWSLRSSRNGQVSTVRFGSPSRLPVTGDWDGDGRTDLGTWNPSTARFALRTDRPSLRVRHVRYGRPR